MKKKDKKGYINIIVGILGILFLGGVFYFASNNEDPVGTALRIIRTQQGGLATSTTGVAGSVPIYNATTDRYDPAPLTAGTNITITNADGSITIDSGGGGASFGQAWEIDSTGALAPTTTPLAVKADWFVATSTTATSTLTNAEIGGFAFFDDTNNRLSLNAEENNIIINGSTFGSSLLSHGIVDTETQFSTHRHSNTASIGGSFDCARTRGTEGTETAVQDGDRLCDWTILGHDGTDFLQAARLNVDVKGTVASNQMWGAWIFRTANGGVNTIERFRIEPNGNVGIGTTTPYTKLGVSGEIVAANFTATTTATSTLPELDVTGLQVSTSQQFDNLTSALIITGSTGVLSEYTGTTCTNQFVRALSALGVATCETVANTDLANSTVSYGGIQLSLGGTDATPAFDLTDATSLPIVAGTSGTLTVARGGTGASTLTGLLQGNGTSAFTAITGTIGQSLFYNGTNTASATSTLSISTASKIGVGTTSPFARFSVEGLTTGTTDYAFQVTDSSEAPLFSVQDNGTTTVSAPTAATSTMYIYSTASGKGGGVIIEDTDGAGCSLITTLNGVIEGQTITCPIE